MRKILFIFLAVIITSCTQSDKFMVSGTVEGGTGEMIYLIHNGLMKTTVLDSLTISQDTKFSFKAQSPEYPDFFSLKIANKQIQFAIDSTETIEIHTSLDKFSTDYKISGSESSADIQTLKASVRKVQQKAKEISPNLSSAERKRLIDQLSILVEEYKAVAKPIIMKNPRSTAAYYAIYQQIGGAYIFSPYDKSDRQFCAAIATSYNTFMPDYNRSQNLTATVLDAIKAERQEKSRETWREIVEQAGIGYIDIELADKNGKMRKLSDLSGKVVLLDFSMHGVEGSVEYTFALRELHNKYAPRGFEIYQVSLDASQYIWEDAVAHLPWVCVRDADGPNTRAVQNYNLQSIPTYFLIDRNGDIIGRNLDFSALSKEIEKLL